MSKFKSEENQALVRLSQENSLFILAWLYKRTKMAINLNVEGLERSSSDFEILLRRNIRLSTAFFINPVWLFPKKQHASRKPIFDLLYIFMGLLAFTAVSY